MRQMGRNGIKYCERFYLAETMYADHLQLKQKDKFKIASTGISSLTGKRLSHALA